MPIKQAAINSYLFGLGWFGAGISWVHVSIDQFGGLPLIVSLAIMAILCAYLALFPALATVLAARFIQTRAVNILLLPSCWIFTEWLRSWFLTGFPWLSIGYSQIDSPLAKLAPILGEVGISFVMLLMVVTLITLYHQQQRLLSSMLLLGTLVTTCASHFTDFIQPTGITKDVALVQGNIAQDLNGAQNLNGQPCLNI